MSINQIKINPGDFVYIPHLSEDVHEVKDYRQLPYDDAKLGVDINNEVTYFNANGYAIEGQGRPTPIAIAYPATQSFKDSLESFWKINLAPARPRQPNHSLEVREALERGETPLCWVSSCEIDQDNLSNRKGIINFISSVNDQGVFLTRAGTEWEYAQLVKPEEVFSAEQLGGSDSE
ncbi:MAG: hypothetical protein Q4P13_07380 [Psychrobacter sp.]|nr:hypothetical protein [Psychrobacter sp.]